MRPNRPVAAFLLILSGLLSLPAKAGMMFCNRTPDAIEAAIGYRETLDWISEGWWRIEPDQCARVFGKPLTQRFYFYHARALAHTLPDRPPLVWAGKYEFCTDIKAFRIEGDGDCETRSYHTQGFHQIDIGSNTRDYTLDFRNESSAH
jgi:uncharacterized membrane protein